MMVDYAILCLDRNRRPREIDGMITWGKFRGRFGHTGALLARLGIATALFYAVAVLYWGTAGSGGAEAFLHPLIPTAVFAAVISLPIGTGLLVSWRMTSARNAS